MAKTEARGGPPLNDEGGLDITDLMDRATRKRRIAKERIVEQFGDVLRQTGAVFVDCGQELGHVYVFRKPDGYGYDIKWLSQHQIRTLAGRID